jgi:hypothetical protein
MGIYISSFAKDLVCTPRPYSPPVVRLSKISSSPCPVGAHGPGMSTHHHEYGFPSSHSTNSVSIALFLGGWLYEAREQVGAFGLVFGWTSMSEPPRSNRLKACSCNSTGDIRRKRGRWSPVYRHALGRSVYHALIRRANPVQRISWGVQSWALHVGLYG